MLIARAVASRDKDGTGDERRPRARVSVAPRACVLLLDKPLGLSSNQALQKAKVVAARRKKPATPAPRLIR